VHSARLSLRIETLQLPASLGITLFFFAAAWHLGLTVVLFGALLLLSILTTLLSARAFAVVVVGLAPLPSIGALVGASIPLGLDPLDVLVVMALSVAMLRGTPAAFREERPLLRLIGLNLAVFVVAWYRTYGGHVTGSGIGALVKPVVVLLAATCVLQLLEPEERVDRAARAMGWALIVIAASVLLQRLGVYRTAHQTQYDVILGAKQYGGLMLDGNSAGGLFAVFALPVYVLLRSSGARTLGIAVLAAAVTVLLISLSRSSVAGAAAGLASLVMLQRRRLEGARLSVGLAAIGGLAALTVGRGELSQFAKSLSGYHSDPNAALSGRLAIWRQARIFLDQGHHLVFGGGLDSFRAFALSGPLQHAFATHSVVLRLLTTGGVIMLALFAALIFALWLVGRTPSTDVGVALRLAVVSFLVVGLALDVDVFARTWTWLWLLAGLAAYDRLGPQAESAAATNRLAMPSIPQYSSRERVGSNPSGLEAPK
jgi:hypothetical protein